MSRCTYWVEHKREDCGEVYEYAAPHPSAAERDEHARVLREDDPGAYDVVTYEQAS